MLESPSCPACPHRRFARSRSLVLPPPVAASDPPPPPLFIVVAAGAVSFVHIVKAAEPLFTALFRYDSLCTHAPVLFLDMPPTFAQPFSSFTGSSFSSVLRSLVRCGDTSGAPSRRAVSQMLVVGVGDALFRAHQSSFPCCSRKNRTESAVSLRKRQIVVHDATVGEFWRSCDHLRLHLPPLLSKKNPCISRSMASVLYVKNELTKHHTHESISLVIASLSPKP